MSNIFNQNAYQNYHYRQQRDNPRKVLGTTFDPYQPKISSQVTQEKYIQSLGSTLQRGITPQKPYENNSYKNGRRSSSTAPLINNSYNIINNNGQFGKTKNFASYKNNKDHVAELFNYPSNEERNANQSPYSVYTTSNTKVNRTPQINKFKNKKEVNDIPIIDDIENKVKNMDDFAINDPNNKNNYFNSQRIPNKYINNVNYQNKEFNNENDFSKEKISEINISEYSDDNCTLIKSFAYKENPNRGYRDYMEDKSRVVQNINGDKNSHLFCLFDGHGGVNVSQFLQDNFYKYFKEMLPMSNPQENFKELFNIIDNKIKDLNLLNIGSTACIIYITKENGKKVLYSANIGDTRSVLISSNDYKRLSYDHRATDTNEYNRIVQSGGIVFAGRVYGTLMLSRAFGDWELKSYGVISEPHVTKININENDKYVIMASDGIWDVLDDADVYEMSKNFENSKDLCNNIVEKALDKGSMDNISCFVINLN